jgi:hypothetical protein
MIPFNPREAKQTELTEHCDHNRILVMEPTMAACLKCATQLKLCAEVDCYNIIPDNEQYCSKHGDKDGTVY